MGIYINNIVLPFAADEEEAFTIAAKRLGGATTRSQLSLRRRSVDARRKNDIKFVYSIAAKLNDETSEKKLVEKIKDNNIVFREKGKPLNGALKEAPSSVARPVVVGFGPAGMFASLLLAQAGMRPIVLERGSTVEHRVEQVNSFWRTGELDSNSNVQFGEGGAGTFSDGKLNTGIGDDICDAVLETFVRFGASSDILTNARPHVGTDVLRDVVKNIRQEILKLGGEILFNRTLTDVVLTDGKVHAAVLEGGLRIDTDIIVLAVGHSARDTFEMLLGKGILLEQKPFSAGVRLEQRQNSLDKAVYGKFAGHPKLPPAEYKLSHREGNRGVYSFCMCPGGHVVASSSEEGMVVTNGMSYKSRAGVNANAAIVVSVELGDLESSHPLAGILFQRDLERTAFAAGGGEYRAPVQRVEDMVRERVSSSFDGVEPTYQRGTTFCDLNGVLPSFISEFIKKGFAQFDKALPGFDSGRGLLTGVETRTSSPVRIVRNVQREAVGIQGLYPAGEGSGYAGGIMSAAVDGIKTAAAIINHD